MLPVGRPSNPYAVWSASLDLEPLAPDACEIEPGSAACTYWHIKKRAMRGGVLSRREAEFVGLIETPAPTGGWRYPNLTDAVADRPDSDARLLQHLMSVDVSVPMSAFLSR